MSQKETLAALSQLQFAFRNDLDEVQLDYYVVKLADIKPTTLGIAVDQLVNESRFLPTIAEIRAKSQAISNYVNAVDEHETPAEAWRKVQEAIGYGGYDKGLERLDGAVLVVAKRFWREICYEDNSTQYSVRSKFIEAYKVEVSRTIERDKIQGAIQNVPLMVATRE